MRHETYLDRGEKNSDEAKNSRSRGHARRFLSDVYQTEGNIEREDSTVAALWLFGVVRHSRKVGSCEAVVLGKGRAGDSRP